MLIFIPIEARIVVVVCIVLALVLVLFVDDSTSSVKSSSGSFLGLTSADFRFFLGSFRSDLRDNNRDGILGDLSLHVWSSGVSRGAVSATSEIRPPCRLGALELLRFDIDIVVLDMTLVSTE
jgi:hypothetical protein